MGMISYNGNQVKEDNKLLLSESQVTGIKMIVEGCLEKESHKEPRQFREYENHDLVYVVTDTLKDEYGDYELIRVYSTFNDAVKYVETHPHAEIKPRPVIDEGEGGD